ncbi:hypothetical protein B1B04_08345 [Lysinibacillus sp. KCTC 33748]|uniref:hypothetical protein n=1 Tax=unclassified Lysinibacillus TaxID=2636778 RepID=UPI0009A6BE00|nr:MULTISPECIES: hypothetical protein [unclassified Lysinibacillus]OXS74892.1 hypothetical protein B1B04_08345 [Lysinibacillus sp. KCTC 33748]SKB59328.1 hypothetical protein SAMN06295926_104150 [Lysinibacillus sp. AC-3]
MSNLAEQFHSPQMGQPQFQGGGALAQVSASREMEEVKGQIFMAKSFPRNIYEAEKRILDACKRFSLADAALYSYPRGGTNVTGPSIRLAEVLAQNWGNISFGVKELEQRNGESTAMAFCWDLETNTRQEKTFTVKHSIKTKKGLKILSDPRDIYEKVANDGARRLRSCILSIIPGDVVEKALKECEVTMQGNNTEPLKDRLANALKLLKEYFKVTQEMVEDKFGYKTSEFTERDYVDLGKIYNSLCDGMSKVEDWFDKEIGKNQTSGLTAEFEKSQEQLKTEVKKDVNVIPIEQPELSLE